VLSAAGYRSSQTVSYHDNFGFDPRTLDEYAVRWWVTMKPQADLATIARSGATVVQERPSALPVFWLARGDDDLRPSIRDITWGRNDVRVEFAEPVSGRLVFAQPVFPGWTASAGATSLTVIEHHHLMAVDLPAPATTVTFAYRPSWIWWTSAVAVAAFALAVLAIARAATARLEA
jgi:hypothetical protein